MNALKLLLLMISVACNIVLLAQLSTLNSSTVPDGSQIADSPVPPEHLPAFTEDERPAGKPDAVEHASKPLVAEPIGGVENLGELARQMLNDGVPRDWVRWGIEPEVNRRAYRQVVGDYATNHAPAWVRTRAETRPGASIAEALAQREAVLRVITEHAE